jgi:hypothetical protein
MIPLPDEYTLRARVAPVIVVVAPAVVFAAASAVLRARVAAVSGVIGIALLVLAAQLARDAGKRREQGLWQSWGGSPTMRRLRYRDAGDREAVRLTHARIERLFGHATPTEEAETADPAAADAAYERAITSMRERTRDRKSFNLLFSENADYGFRRNLFGLRAWGIGVAVLTLGASVVLGLLSDGSGKDRLLAAGIPGVAAALALGLFVFVITPAWVRVPAEAYAERLLGALEQLDD